MVKTCSKCGDTKDESNCNTGLGNFGDSAERLMTAAAYLLRAKGVHDGSKAL